MVRSNFARNEFTAWRGLFCTADGFQGGFCAGVGYMNAASGFKSQLDIPLCKSVFGIRKNFFRLTKTLFCAELLCFRNKRGILIPPYPLSGMRMIAFATVEARNRRSSYETG